MVRKYETIVLVDGSLPVESAAKEKETIEQLFQKETVFEKTEEWGKRELAYEIAGNRSAYYYQFVFTAEGDIAEKLTQIFKLDAKIIRHMTVLFEEKQVIVEREDRRPNGDEDEERDRNNA